MSTNKTIDIEPGDVFHYRDHMYQTRDGQSRVVFFSGLQPWQSTNVHGHSGAVPISSDNAHAMLALMGYGVKYVAEPVVKPARATVAWPTHCAVGIGGGGIYILGAEHECEEWVKHETSIYKVVPMPRPPVAAANDVVVDMMREQIADLQERVNVLEGEPKGREPEVERLKCANAEMAADVERMKAANRDQAKTVERLHQQSEERKELLQHAMTMAIGRGMTAGLLANALAACVSGMGPDSPSADEALKAVEIDDVACRLMRKAVQGTLAMRTKGQKVRAWEKNGGGE